MSVTNRDSDWQWRAHEDELTILGKQSPDDLPCNVEYTCRVRRTMRTVNIQAEFPQVGVQFVNLLADKVIHIWLPDRAVCVLLPC